MITISDDIKKLMQTYVKYPPRKLQSESYDGPIEISKYEQFQWARDQLAKEGVNIAGSIGRRVQMRIPPNQVLFLGQHRWAAFDRPQEPLPDEIQDIALA